MIGRYDRFPDIIQAKASLAYSFPAQKLVHIIVDALEEMNGISEDAPSELASRKQSLQCKYEIGVAEKVYFNYLDDEEYRRLKKQLSKSSVRVLDFLVCIFYRTLGKNGKDTALWSDWQYVRFFLKSLGQLEINVHHFKGTRKIPLDVLIQKLVAYLNGRAKKRRLAMLKVTELIGH
jgi:hypothetical protein